MFNIFQAGAKLYSLNVNGQATQPLTALALPVNVALAANLTPRFTRFNTYVVMVNSPTRPITIDKYGVVRILTPLAPSSAPAITGASGGQLTGTFTAQQTYKIFDGIGNLIAESDYGPISNTTTIYSNYLRATNLNLSADAVSCSQLYRTTDNGGVMFPWIEVPGNTNTTMQDDTADASLGTLGAPVRGSAPDLTLIANWAGRLWGVDRNIIDYLRWTEGGTAYAWGAFNSMPIGAVGDDSTGITALAPRRDALGVGRLNQLTQVTGDGAGTPFAPTILAQSLGIVSQESVVIYRDTVFFLWLDGVYTWDANGITCISDKGNVRSWFATDSYFQRSLFSQAFAGIDPATQTYRLFLTDASGAVRWVEYDLISGKWTGPHNTDACTPSSAFALRGAQGEQLLGMGSLEGFASVDTETRSDWDLVPISESIFTKLYSGDGGPDTVTSFLDPTFFGEPTVGTLRVVPLLGNDQLHLQFGASQTWPLSQGRSRLFRLGSGRFCQLLLSNSALGVNPVIYGMTIPTTMIGRR